MHEDHPNPICGECGKAFATAKELGENADNVHRAQTSETNPTNMALGWEQYKTD